MRCLLFYCIIPEEALHLCRAFLFSVRNKIQRHCSDGLRRAVKGVNVPQAGIQPFSAENGNIRCHPLNTKKQQRIEGGHRQPGGEREAEPVAGLCSLPGDTDIAVGGNLTSGQTPDFTAALIVERIRNTGKVGRQAVNRAALALIDGDRLAVDG